MNDLNRPLLGEPNAPCRTCGAPLAEDQRYCLQCGDRRAEARLPFLDILARQVPAAAVTETTSTTVRRGWGPGSTLVAGVACLLLALGVGVLIGGWGNGDSVGAGPPQVISVGGGAVAPAAAAAPASTATPAAAAAAAAAAATAVKRKKSPASSPSGSKATNSTVKSLDSTSGTDYSKKSSKLPKVLGTGGKAPAKDNKPAAGGGDFQTIG